MINLRFLQNHSKHCGKSMISLSCYAFLPLDAKKLWGYLLNQKLNYNATGTISNIECTRRKKGPEEKRNIGESVRGCVCYKRPGEFYGGKVMCP